MPTYDWQTLLNDWNRRLFESQLSADVPKAVRDSKWLGRSKANDLQIEALEKRIDRTLPPSYRQFLAVTNGWQLVSMEIEQLREVASVAWYSERHQDTIDALDRLGFDRTLVGIMQISLEVSESERGHTILLNPDVVDLDGEWQAVRVYEEDPPEYYSSFWALMNAEYEHLRVALAFIDRPAGGSAVTGGHEANREKIDSTLYFVSERIKLCRQGLSNKRTPQDQLLEMERLIRLLEKLQARLTELKMNENDPHLLSEQLDLLRRDLDQQNFHENNYGFLSLIGYSKMLLGDA